MRFISSSVEKKESNICRRTRKENIKKKNENTGTREQKTGGNVSEKMCTGNEIEEEKEKSLGGQP